MLSGFGVKTMNTRTLEIIAAGLLVDFLNQHDIIPLEDGALSVHQYAPHIVLEVCGKSNSDKDSDDLFSSLVEFVDKHNVYSSVKFSAYDVKVYSNVYVSIAQ